MLDDPRGSSRPSVYAQAGHIMQCLDETFHQIQSMSSDIAIRSVVRVFVDRLVCAAYAQYHRARSPAALSPDHWIPATGLELFNEMRQVQKLNRQMDTFNRHYPVCAEPQSGDAACRILRDLMVDLQQLQTLDRAYEDSLANRNLSTLLQDQTKETKESTKKSIQIGRLSRLA